MQINGRKLRIAFVTADLWLGGGNIFVLNLSEQLVRSGFECHVFTVWDESYLSQDFERLGVPVSCKPSPGTIYEDRILNVLMLLRAYAPDVIISGSESENCEVIRYVPREIPRIAVFHLALPGTLASACIYREYFDIAVAVSEAVGDALRQSMAANSLPIRVVKLGIKSTSSSTPRTFEPSKPLQILYLGRLEDPAKRVRIFPRILDRLQSTSIPFVWNIAGVGPEREYLEFEMAKGKAGQQVRFLGPVPHSEVGRLLDQNDVFLLTSDSESFCLSLHEAMAAGLVPVVSDIPGPVGDIVDEASGISVPVDNPVGYADAIIWLHEHREAMVKMSAASRSRIQSEHSAEAMGERWVDVLHDIAPASAAWPERWKIRAPLQTDRPLHFSRPARILRRWLARIFSILSSVSVLQEHFEIRASRGRGSDRYNDKTQSQ